VNVAADKLREQIAEILRVWGMPADYVEQTADVMVETDLRGIDSHGVGMIAKYHEWGHMGGIAFDAPITVETDLPAVAVVDGGHGLGHPVGVFAMKLAIEKAAAGGVGLVVAHNSNHYGPAGYYAMMALERNFLGMSMTSAPGAAMVPTFGKEPKLGTNPIALAAPARRNPPFVLDMATTTVAIGKINIARRLGIPLPEGWATDDHGRPLTDPAEAGRLRHLSPLGGTRELGSHKGYGLGAMVEILCSTLSGGAIACVNQRLGRGDARGHVGHFFMAINPAAFRPAGAFEDDLDDLIDTLRATAPADPDQPVLVAGDPQAEAKEMRLREGIPLADALVEEIRETCRSSNARFMLDG
jgi:LDH2 family malate/lactate/ureidoglycolate dehydrogenase